ncbi:MAG: hypothetical protein JWM78_253 [Verrucomicrobiaceae bacterium]|nr:hypothetical protein [Verrucomicrobiaceae bacterium]
MKKLIFLSAVMMSTFLLNGCGRPSNPTPETQTDASTAPAEQNDGTEPITLHARIDYVSTSNSGALSQSKSIFSLEIQEPARRDGKGKSATYMQEENAPEKVQGFVHGQGTANLDSGDTKLQENYDKSVSFANLAKPDKGIFTISMPQPSSIGDGLSVQINIHASVAGTQSAKITAGGKSVDTEPTMSRPLLCSDQTKFFDDGSDGCGVELTVDAVPTAAKDAGGEVMLPKIKEALSQPTAEWAMALLGQMYGATTEYRDNGHFIIRFVKKYDLTKEDTAMTSDINITVWSTGRDEKWSPANLPPLKTL